MVDIIPNTALEMDGLELMQQIADDSLDAIFFDPQYQQLIDKLGYGNAGEQRQQRRGELEAMDNKTQCIWVQEMNRILRPSGHLFLWQDMFAFASAYPLFTTGSLEVVSAIVWDKGRMGMGYRARSCTEFLRIYQKPPKRAKGVWRDNAIKDCWHETIDKPKSKHPHTKPYGLIKRLIECVSPESTPERESIIGDFCAGSFTTMDACLAANRTFIGCDLSLQYRKD